MFMLPDSVFYPDTPYQRAPCAACRAETPNPATHRTAKRDASAQPGGRRARQTAVDERRARDEDLALGQVDRLRAEVRDRLPAAGACEPEHLRTGGVVPPEQPLGVLQLVPQGEGAPVHAQRRVGVGALGL